jgi:acyl-CoA synthetase (AMP-forming)/AMP-acid ligase II
MRDVFLRPAAPLFEIESRDIEGSLHALVERIAAAEPDRVAVKAHGLALTYGELDTRANILANTILERLGTAREPVAILCEKTLELAIAMLGVLKTGKFYVPLDVAADNTAVLAECNARLLLTPELVDAWSSGSRNKSKPQIAAGELAMVLFTSGSTGRPKGVMQSHRNFVSDLRQVIATGRYCADDRAIVLPPVTFIGANALFFAVLAAGGAAFLFDVRTEGWSALRRTLEEEQITIYHSTGTVFFNLTEQLKDKKEVVSVRLVRLAGEAIYKRDFDRFKLWFSDECVFASALGTTETNILRQFFADKNTELKGNIVPAGYPVPTKEILLYAEDGTLAKSGEIGEIAVRSKFLSLGYYKRSDLTAKAFEEEGEGYRIYHTGDYGRLAEDGCLEYLGRRDSQIKLFGQKILLPEIEGALLNHPDVKEVFVTAKEVRPGDQRLVAYVGSGTVSPPELRVFLAEHLPAVMIPHAFVILLKLPRTLQGKVAQDQLPPPELSRPAMTTPLRPASNMIEALLVELWAKVLLVEPVGVDDGLLDLGGNSVLATMIAARLNEILDVNVSVKDVLQQKTIAGLATLLDRRFGGRLEHELEKLLAEGERG